MKDYSVLNGMIENQKSELRTAYDKGYNHGVRDFDLILATSKKEEEGYNRGLEDAWACCKRFLNSDDKVCDKIFGVSGWADFLDQSPSDAIEKFKEYDEKQEHIVRCCKNCKHSENGMVGNGKRCADCHYDRVSKGNTLFEPMETDNSKIEVGDEVKRADIDKSLVIIKFTEEGWALGMNEEGNISDVKLSVYKKTGKHFDQIAEVFNSLKGDIDA